MDQDKKQPILVTGGLGYIGSHTVVELVNAGYSVVIVDNLANSNLKCLDRIYQITGKGEETIKFEQEDLKNLNELDQIFKKHNPSAVIHFAALKAVGESV